MQLVALRDWYPQMADRWTGRRIPWSDRTHWVHHHTVGGTGVNPLAYARLVADMHYDRWGVPGGYNVLVGTDGVLRAMCGLDHQGVHAGTHEWNRRGLGLAFQGDFRNSPPSDLMLDAARSLIVEHPLDQTTHRAVRPEPTTCPGDALIDLLPLEDDMAKIPLEWWAKDAFKWAIDNGLYTEQRDLAKVREEYDFQQLVVFHHRYHSKFGGQTGTHNHDRRYIKDITVSR